MFGGILDAVTNTASKLAPLATFINPGVGAAMGAVGSYLGGQSANKANQQMAQQQMAFQADMSGTAYQRSTKDLIAAGLNPMLAYTQGGASTPQGATATMENVLGNSTNSAFQSAVQAQNVRNAQAQIQLTGAQIDNTEADAAYKRQLTTTEILKSPYYKLQDKVALSQMAVNNASAEQAYENAKNLKERTISEQLGAPYGTFGSGQAARFGYYLGNSAAQLYKDYKGK
jgi:hypothetical protein